MTEPTLRAQEHTGTGPGAFTPDGCSVEMYARLPTGGEPEIVAAEAPPGATLLELGAGAGRMTRPLVRAGLRVTAVDESPEMLARIGGDVPTVRSTIEELDLGTRFDVVLLASFLVNTADEALRPRLLDTCSRHVAAGGMVLIQREGRGHSEKVPGSEWHRDGMTMRVASREPVGGGVSRSRLEYTFEDAAWSQTFLSHPLPEPLFAEVLERSGLRVDRYLTEDRTWVRALPVGPRTS